jgi:predicted dithiol-disulfide oxidoreductase (DUF899 family)
MTTPRIVSKRKAETRKAHLQGGRSRAARRDEAARGGARTPWVKVEEPYTFDAAEGRVSRHCRRQASS